MRYLICNDLLPKIYKHCSKCGTKTSFVNTQRFRVNANKKHLDIWMIFHCERCQSTFNLTIHERVNPQSLQPDILRGYQTNCGELTHQLAYKKELYSKSGQQMILDLDKVYIKGPGIEFSNKLRDERPIAITFEIPQEYSGLYRIDWALQQVTGYSKSQLHKFWDQGAIKVSRYSQDCSDSLDVKSIKSLKGCFSDLMTTIEFASLAPVDGLRP